jgi:hypothetical protein
LAGSGSDFKKRQDPVQDPDPDPGLNKFYPLLSEREKLADPFSVAPFIDQKVKQQRFLKYL